MNGRSGERLAFDAPRRKITIVTRERNCDCPLVNDNRMPACYCDCSIGWQRHTYETILGKPVEAEVKESVLRGAKRCVFEVRLV
jgi:hypothetical protein